MDLLNRFHPDMMGKKTHKQLNNFIGQKRSSNNNNNNNHGLVIM